MKDCRKHCKNKTARSPSYNYWFPLASVWFLNKSSSQSVMILKHVEGSFIFRFLVTRITGDQFRFHIPGWDLSSLIEVWFCYFLWVSRILVFVLTGEWIFSKGEPWYGWKNCRDEEIKSTGFRSCVCQLVTLVAMWIHCRPTPWNAFVWCWSKEKVTLQKRSINHFQQLKNSLGDILCRYLELFSNFFYYALSSRFPTPSICFLSNFIDLLPFTCLFAGILYEYLPAEFSFGFDAVFGTVYLPRPNRIPIRPVLGSSRPISSLD